MNIICFYSGINVFKIINSMYSRKILDILLQVFYIINPNYLIHGIVSCLGVVSNYSYDDSLKFLTPKIWAIDISNLIENENITLFKNKIYSN